MKNTYLFALLLSLQQFKYAPYPVTFKCLLTYVSFDTVWPTFTTCQRFTRHSHTLFPPPLFLTRECPTDRREQEKKRGKSEEEKSSRQSDRGDKGEKTGLRVLQERRKKGVESLNLRSEKKRRHKIDIESM